jgi:putative membrane protein
MLLAALGALATMLVVALIHWRYDPAFAAELRASLKIGRGDAPLGEEALREMLKNHERT